MTIPQATQVGLYFLMFQSAILNFRVKEASEKVDRGSLKVYPRYSENMRVAEILFWHRTSDSLPVGGIGL